MFKITRKETTWGGRPLILESGRIARQADGAVLVTYGGTQVLVTAVAQKTPRVGIDFFPLTVNYQEKTFAAGLFQARRAAFREGDPDLAPDRPADPAAVPQGIPQRDPDHLHRAGA
jgi:hypothetical protein